MSRLQAGMSLEAFLHIPVGVPPSSHHPAGSGSQSARTWAAGAPHAHRPQPLPARGGLRSVVTAQSSVTTARSRCDDGDYIQDDSVHIVSSIIRATREEALLALQRSAVLQQEVRGGGLRCLAFGGVVGVSVNALLCEVNIYWWRLCLRPSPLVLGAVLCIGS